MPVNGQNVTKHVADSVEYNKVTVIHPVGVAVRRTDGLDDSF